MEEIWGPLWGSLKKIAAGEETAYWYPGNGSLTWFDTIELNVHLEGGEMEIP